MSRKSLLFLLTAILLLTFIPLAQADPGTVEPKLTPRQQEEIAPLYNQLFETRNRIIDKYVEFKVLDPDKATKKKAKLQKIKEGIKENGYLPPKFHRQNGKCLRDQKQE